LFSLLLLLLHLLSFQLRRPISHFILSFVPLLHSFSSYSFISSSSANFSCSSSPPPSSVSWPAATCNRGLKMVNLHCTPVQIERRLMLWAAQNRIEVYLKDIE
jgi:hypothetical protein